MPAAIPPPSELSDPAGKPAVEAPGAAEALGVQDASEALSAVRARLLGTRTVEAVADVFNLLGDPTRVRLVDALSHGERCVCDLASLVGLSESAVSHQLRLLRASRLVRVRREGRHSYYSLDDHHVIGLLHDTRKHVEEDHS
jgi:DNA-binding transcriptional ArsR family regulator